MNFVQNRFTPFITSQKYPLLIALVFFLIVCYVGFSYHSYWIVDQDGIHLLRGGEQIINGDGQNVHFTTTPPTAAIFWLAFPRTSVQAQIAVLALHISPRSAARSTSERMTASTVPNYGKVMGLQPER